MIEARNYTTNDVRTIYSRRSRAYRNMVAPLEFHNHLRAIEMAAIRPDETILEVATGPGLAIREIAQKAAPTVVRGVDLSPGMLAVARETLQEAGVHNVELAEGNATDLHFPDATFDVLYNGYMLDLIPLAQIPVVLAEFKRVLKPGGRLILLNMSKADAHTMTLCERIYPLLPKKFVLYVMGGCRPVLMEKPVKEAGFHSVEREFLPGQFPSEIVTAYK